MNEKLRACFAEFLATFTLIFIGVGSIMANNATGGALGITGIAIAHGLAIAIGVCAIGHISGGHINPAVTIAMMATKRMGLFLGLGYILFQLAGGTFGAWLLTKVLPAQLALNTNLGIPALGFGITQNAGMVIEVALTFLLVLAIFGSAIDPRGPKSIAGFVIGMAVTMDVFLGGPFTGAAMNPARYFGPALVSGNWANCGVYWAGPIFGAVLAAYVYDRLLMRR